MTESANGRDARLSARELAWYASGSIPAGIGVLAWNYLVFYYNQVLGIPGAVIGIAALLNSVFDALTDPIAGTISDRTRGRWGRRHPFLFLAAVPSALTFVLMFWVPPGFSLGHLMAWLLVLHLVKRLFDTFYAVPYLALGAEISSDHEERTRIATWRGIFFNIGRSSAGALLLLAFLRPTEQYPNGQLNPEGYVQFGAWMTGIILICLAASAWKTRHWIPRLTTAAPQAGITLGQVFDELRNSLANRSFRAVLFGSVSRHMAWGMSDALGIFMITFFWGVSTDILFLWGVGMFTGLFMGLPFWRNMASRFDKKPIAIAGDITYLFFFCTPYLLKVAGAWPDNTSPLYIPLYILTTGFLAHFGIAASGLMVGSMLGDISDDDELTNGRRREGVIFGAESFSWKALTGLGPLMAGLVIDAVGLSDKVKPEEVAAETVTALGLAQGGVMFVFFVLAIFFISRYDLTRGKHERILEQLRERKAAELAADS
jgi:Na+/melibiose symporter-like transporter